jgi:DNA-binding NarL/FixJ family response regulator
MLRVDPVSLSVCPGSTFMTVHLADQWTKLLSPREREVVLLVANGLSNKEIARQLGLSCGTVKIHVHSIFQKLGAKSRYSLIGQGELLPAAQ